MASGSNFLELFANLVVFYIGNHHTESRPWNSLGCRCLHLGILSFSFVLLQSQFLIEQQLFDPGSLEVQN